MHFSVGNGQPWSQGASSPAQKLGVLEWRVGGTLVPLAPLFSPPPASFLTQPFIPETQQQQKITSVLTLYLPEY